MLKPRRFGYIVFVFSFLLYILIGYGIERHETFPLFACYFAVFAMYLIAVFRHESMNEGELRFWMAAAVLFRAGLLFSVPALSDDFYRFIWDGRLLAAGYHPFAEVPSYYLSHAVSIPGISPELFSKLNATETFTVYPPMAQLVFWLSATLSPDSVYGSVIAMRIVIFSFEIATLWMLLKILRNFKQPAGRALLYGLNPLVILEITGNLHFEGMMVFFLLLAIHLLRRQPVLSSTAYAFSVCTKLIPLIFLPMLFRYLGWKKAFFYWFMTSVFGVLIFLPLLNADIVYGLSTSLGYYFQRFEFNASIYYLIREAGFVLAGFNIIHYAGPLLAVAATLLILFISFSKSTATSPEASRNALFAKMLWCLLIYFLCTTILHPWYIVTLLAISTLTPFRFPLVWTGAIFLTYAGYTETAYNENLFLVTLEYVIVVAYLLYETMIWTKQRNHS